jgi:transglutaminase-like putative cysteine protease
MRRYRIVHTTVMDYDQPVRASHNEVRMSPLNEPGQSTLENRIRVRPITWSHVYRDHWGTHVTAMESLADHQHLEIEATSTVERTDLPEAAPTGGWEALAEPALVDRSSEWLMDSVRTRPGEGLVALAESVRDAATPREAAARLAETIRATMVYERGATGVKARGEEAWSLGNGVCQDFAHIAIGALRHLQVPARYVSGYLDPAVDTEVGATSEGESHAWVEFWDNAWLPIDPTNVGPVGQGYVVVARGRDYEDVSPFKGVYAGRGVADPKVSVRFTRLA